MKRVLMSVLLCIVMVGLVACAVHGDRWLGEESNAAVSHVLGCGVPLMMAAFAAALPFLPLMGRLAPEPDPRRPLRRPVFFFQPPEYSS